MIQSLNVWGNFGILSMNKETFNVPGGTVLDRLQEFKTSENQKANTKGPSCICGQPSKYLTGEISELENQKTQLNKVDPKTEE